MTKHDDASFDFGYEIATSPICRACGRTLPPRKPGAPGRNREWCDDACKRLGNRLDAVELLFALVAKRMTPTAKLAWRARIWRLANYVNGPTTAKAQR